MSRHNRERRELMRLARQGVELTPEQKAKMRKGARKSASRMRAAESQKLTKAA